jgi:outer membrane receptor protein involved in Fe transport
MITGATLLAAGGAFAQSADSGTTVGEVVVTGSRIPHPNLTTASPVTTVTAQSIKLQGTVNVEDFINNLPQAFAEFGQYESNGAVGIATVDLRGLGSSRTLVMIDGKRLQPGDPTLPVADLNFIPPSLIDHVDVLTGGASAVYGSDAIAGVVNFVMKKNFQGLQVDAESSVAEADNNNSQARAANKLSGSFGFPTVAMPTKTEWDGQRDTVTITGGVNAPDDKGNVEFYFGKTTITGVTEAKRDWSSCALTTNTSNQKQQYCLGSSTSNIALFQPTSGPGANLNVGSALGKSTYAVGPGGSVSPFGLGDLYNFAPLNYLQRPDTRYNAGEFSTYNINSHVNLYSSFMFMDDHTVADVGPSGSFNGDNVYTIPCNDPLMSAAEQSAMCGAEAGTANTVNANIAHRNVEGGPRVSDIEHMDYRIVFGVKGDLWDGWTYDASAQYGRTVLTDIESGYFLNSKLKNAMDVVEGPTGPECESVLNGTDTKCVPYNIWTPGSITPASLAYLNGVAESSGSTTEQVYTATVTGDLGKYGLKSPFASKPVSVSAGFEYRSENLITSYDAAIQGGDLAGAGGSVLPTSGTQADKDVFGELSVPLASDMPFVKALTFETAYRYSDYTSGGGNDTYKFSLDWQTTPDLMLRGSYERAVRAPNVQDLFAPASPGLVGATDPCAGQSATPAYTASQCYNTFTHSLPGLTLAQYENGGYTLNGVTYGPLYNSGNVDQCVSSQCGSEGGGNPGLQPEIADTISYGFVFTPTFFKGFSLSVDYWNILVKKAITTIPFDTIFSSCALANTDCNLIDRFQGTNFGVYGGEGAGEVIQTEINAGALKTAGVDVEGQYHFRLADFGAPDLGSLTFLFNGTYLDKLTTVIGTTQYNCAGLFGVTCGTPSPQWRHTFRITWNTPWNLQLSANWRYFGSNKLDFDSNQPGLQNGEKDFNPTDEAIPAYNYIDLTATYRFKDKYTFRVGVNNVFDLDPPIVDSENYGISAPAFGNGNTYPQVYDPLGRVIFMGVTADF